MSYKLHSTTVDESSNEILVREMKLRMNHECHRGGDAGAGHIIMTISIMGLNTDKYALTLPHCVVS